MEDMDFSSFDAQRYAEDCADRDAMLYGTDDELDVSNIRDYD